MRQLIPLLLLAAVAACSASPPPAREPEAGCARPVPAPGGDEPDGGVGGTGKTPDPCAGTGG